MANIVRQSVGEYQSTPGDWLKCVKEREQTEEVTLPKLGKAVALRERTTPSKQKTGGVEIAAGKGAMVGLEVHELF